MLVLSIVVMALGFLGLVVFANLKNQALALLATVVMLAGLGIYTYQQLWGDDNMERGVIFQCAIMDQVGAYLKTNASGKSVVLIVDPMVVSQDNENAKELLERRTEAFKEAYGAGFTVVPVEVEGANEEDGASVMDNLKAEDLEKVVTNNAAEIYIIDSSLGLPYGNVPDFQGKTVVLLSGGMAETDQLKRAIEDGMITAVISGNDKKKDPDFEPDEDNLKEAFEHYYIIVDKDNLDKLK